MFFVDLTVTENFIPRETPFLQGWWFCITEGDEAWLAPVPIVCVHHNSEQLCLVSGWATMHFMANYEFNEVREAASYLRAKCYFLVKAKIYNWRGYVVGAWEQHLA